jgi:CRISPR-associated endonuclease/helicase Cas3
MFAPQRVREVRRTGERFVPPADFDIAAYLAGSFGAVRGEGRHKVELWFAPRAAGRVAERVWHPSQQAERQADGGLVLRLEVTDLREVKRWVLWWGAECRVLGPEELRRAVEEELRRALGLYP